MAEKLLLITSMHSVICTMNNEEAYNDWIQIVPDEATEDDLKLIAGDKELMQDACETFTNIIKNYGRDGYYIYETRECLG